MWRSGYKVTLGSNHSNRCVWYWAHLWWIVVVLVILSHSCGVSFSYTMQLSFVHMITHWWPVIVYAYLLQFIQCWPFGWVQLLPLSLFTRHLTLSLTLSLYNADDTRDKKLNQLFCLRHSTTLSRLWKAMSYSNETSYWRYLNYTNTITCRSNTTNPHQQKEIHALGPVNIDHARQEFMQHINAIRSICSQFETEVLGDVVKMGAGAEPAFRKHLTHLKEQAQLESTVMRVKDILESTKETVEQAMNERETSKSKVQTRKLEKLAQSLG